MHRLFLKYLNASLLGSCLILALAAAFLWLCRPGEIEEIEPSIIKASLPKSAFKQPPEAYEKIGEPALALKYQPPKLHLPDLRNMLIYHGKNGRPDAMERNMTLHFSFVGSKQSAAVCPGERLYITFNKKGDGPKYSFSPNNSETSFWVEPAISNNDAAIKLCLKDENSALVEEPAHLRNFTLAEKEYMRNLAQAWEIGKWRVDATLLARQKARWYGPDKFLEEHGGDEFKHTIGKHRIDFGDSDEVYSLFVKQGDSFVFHNDRWIPAFAGLETTNLPLLVIKKIDERVMNFELWDVQGKGKVVLNLLKSSENFTDYNLDQTFKFIGARTRSQFLFEVNNERMLVRPQDWLILTENGWKKLASPQEIDDYVERKLTGTLFVLDKMIRKDDKQVMQGVLYNINRTEALPVEIAMQTINKNPKMHSEPAMGRNLESVGKKAPKIDPPSYAKKTAK